MGSTMRKLTSRRFCLRVAIKIVQRRHSFVAAACSPSAAVKIAVNFVKRGKIDEQRGKIMSSAAKLMDRAVTFVKLAVTFVKLVMTFVKSANE